MHVILVVIYQAYVRYIRVDGPEYSNLNIFYKYFITEHVQLYIPFWFYSGTSIQSTLLVQRYWHPKHATSTAILASKARY